MAVLSMRRYGDPILRLLAAPVAAVTPEIKTLIADMAETMWHQVGIGLAAPQIGVSLRIFVMDDGKRGARAIVNPVVTERGGVVKEEEGCLSLPGIFAERRAQQVAAHRGARRGRPADQLRGAGIAGEDHPARARPPRRRALHRSAAARHPGPDQEENPEGRARARGAPPPRLRALSRSRACGSSSTARRTSRAPRSTLSSPAIRS